MQAATHWTGFLCDAVGPCWIQQLVSVSSERPAGLAFVPLWKKSKNPQGKQGFQNKVWATPQPLPMASFCIKHRRKGRNFLCHIPVALGLKLYSLLSLLSLSDYGSPVLRTRPCQVASLLLVCRSVFLVCHLTQSSQQSWCYFCDHLRLSPEETAALRGQWLFPKDLPACMGWSRGSQARLLPPWRSLSQHAA